MRAKKLKDAKPVDYSLSERLKYLREIRSLTQKDLAQLAGLSQATIAHVEKSTKDPSVDTLMKIANALDVHIATLFSTNDVFIFDLKRLRRKYNNVDKLTPHLYMALGKVIQYARDIGMVK
jgi:transcriptional regulator with XRE-family HTH domain